MMSFLLTSFFFLKKWLVLLPYFAAWPFSSRSPLPSPLIPRSSISLYSPSSPSAPSAPSLVKARGNLQIFSSFHLSILSLYSLSQVLEDTSDDQIGSFSIHLNSKANLGGVRSFDAAAHSERGWFILNSLRRHAEETQRPLLSILHSRDDVVRVTPFFVANCIVVDAKRAVVDLIAKVISLLFLVQSTS